jgi:hypothetical protein
MGCTRQLLEVRLLIGDVCHDLLYTPLVGEADDALHDLGWTKTMREPLRVHDAEHWTANVCPFTYDNCSREIVSETKVMRQNCVL